MDKDAILDITPLGFPWHTPDPFLFCVHHVDAYPAGNEHMGPAASLAGRTIGEDFDGPAVRRDGWRMYHGDVVPGFPQHPHRGFETVTIARRGLIDHSDSLGAAARFGGGDVQWLTAGRGIVHSEMFPLLDRNGPNPAELFQIWLNLPAASKLVDPHFTMLWNQAIPRVTSRDDAGRGAEITVVAGALGGANPLPPPPDSWAARPDSDLAIWTLKLAPEAHFTLPPAQRGTNRTLYYFLGDGLRIGARAVTAPSGVAVRADARLTLENGAGASEILLLQGRPIGEPVAHQGPFVMNTRAELQQAFVDYQRTRFGGWPWPTSGPVHPREERRFAKHVGGRIERPEGETAKS